ncbi:MAG: response regulator transcription factor [Betaproteobacteria bacterium]|nr:winged helix-turn-helix domain-containing protein [Betaproteobacteria bacterium]MBU6511716.1 winged helix-turn-helix domain-containing protein [Betaproteobacteria bacterium]MDE1954209.1 response regulator transcription factor [Betaproteobacteria bacterium]MDE2151656.1 response regulator transcription factor [Betaproteobacteria bacterium]MDE2478117.1 response regulator transcription factor [Betaproteobacteria bacterium]
MLPTGPAPAPAGDGEPAVKHSVLYVGFGHAAPRPLDNSQAAEPDTALKQLADGSSWAAMLRCAEQARAATDWIMRVRHHPASSQAVLVALLEDPGGPLALQALRAGADAVVGLRFAPALLQAQLARLRERVAPVPAGWLSVAPDSTLDAPTRELRCGNERQTLQPQLFRLLWALCERPGRVLSAASLRVALDIPARADAQALHTAVGRLRRLLQRHGLDAHLQTLHGSGYRWAGTAPCAPGTVSARKHS